MTGQGSRSAANHKIVVDIDQAVDLGLEVEPTLEADPETEAEAEVSAEAEVLPQAEVLPELELEAVPEAEVLPELELEAVPEAEVLPELELEAVPEAEVLSEADGLVLEPDVEPEPANDIPLDPPESRDTPVPSEPKEPVPDHGLLRCEPHNLAYDPSQADGCVLCRSQSPVPAAAPRSRRRGIRWGIIGIVALLLGPVVYYAQRALHASRLEVVDSHVTDAVRGLDLGTGKVVIVHLWATWCSTCREELPVFQALSEELSGDDVDLRMVVISERSPDGLRDFLLDEGFDFPTLRLLPVTDEEMRASFDGVKMNFRNTVPYTAVFDADGLVVDQWTGVRTLAQYRSLIQTAASR